ncbi:MULTISPECIES: Rnf-Nqr domain containing protein [unclassified Pseudomonas]|uniref:Rnf-Nqr domain containing protein n=1 Tax=unclassified Pseudomonas TaxID=196821 RepID=UPI0035C099DE
MTRFWLFGTSLAPLLGATGNLAQGAAIGLCAVSLLLCHQALMWPLRQPLQGPLRLAASLAIAAALATCLQLALRTCALPVALSLGHYPALLCLYCVALDSDLPGASRYRALALHLTGMMSLCLVLGACRQVLAEMANLHLASQAPGALILLGLLLALYNRLRPGTAPSRRQGTL